MYKKSEIPDKFHDHEAIDRLHLVLCFIDDHLLHHKTIEHHPALKSKVEIASDILAKAYQELGQITNTGEQ